MEIDRVYIVNWAKRDEDTDEHGTFKVAFADRMDAVRAMNADFDNALQTAKETYDESQISTIADCEYRSITVDGGVETFWEWSLSELPVA